MPKRTPIANTIPMVRPDSTADLRLTRAGNDSKPSTGEGAADFIGTWCLSTMRVRRVPFSCQRGKRGRPFPGYRRCGVQQVRVALPLTVGGSKGRVSICHPFSRPGCSLRDNRIFGWPRSRSGSFKAFLRARALGLAWRQSEGEVVLFPVPGDCLCPPNSRLTRLA